MNIKYETLEKIVTNRPVDRLDYISNACSEKIVLDIGCFDETALIKRETKHWLHGRLAAKAKLVVGIDNSTKIPREGLHTSEKSTIYRGDGIHVDKILAGSHDYNIIIAGEFIEHIENPLEFFRDIKKHFEGKQLIISTPNGASFANTLLGFISREVQHHDHLHNFTYKILNTLCLRSGFNSWKIVPYRFYATEMILNSVGLKKLSAIMAERFIRIVENLFPLLSFGYIVHIEI